MQLNCSIIRSGFSQVYDTNVLIQAMIIQFTATILHIIVTGTARYCTISTWTDFESDQLSGYNKLLPIFSLLNNNSSAKYCGKDDKQFDW